MKMDIENNIILLKEILRVNNKKVRVIIDDVITNNYDLSTSKNYSEILNKYDIYYTEYALDKSRFRADEVQKSLKEKNINMLPYNNYFGNILTMKTDVPIALYYKGNINALSMPSIAVIGTRFPSIDGIKAGEYVGRVLSSKGYNIVSGLAKGCDTCGHKGCISNKGVTTAVLAHSLDQNIYPFENINLAKQILDNNGLLVSEYSFEVKLEKRYLFDRDRIQAGLSEKIIVVQCGLKSGTLHTVSFGVKNERKIYCIKYKSNDTMNNEHCLGNSELCEKRIAKWINSNDLNKNF